MSKLDKLIAQIIKLDKNLRFEELAKVLINYGYTQHQPQGGGSHYTFRKPHCFPITIPKHSPLDKAYIKMVRDIVAEILEEEQP